MKIKKIALYSYPISTAQGYSHPAIIVSLTNENGNCGWGEIAPLPNLSKESFIDAHDQLQQIPTQISSVDWTKKNILDNLSTLTLYPSVAFGLESALFSLLDPLPHSVVSTTALLMGTVQEILEQAKLRHAQGFTTAKLKVKNLSFEETRYLIYQLAGKFRLRIDVNRAWETGNSLRFFSEFPQDIFDYVEEPFKNPCELEKFTHPLAIDESFPQYFTLKDLDGLKTLKALIFKPTVHGGLAACKPLEAWAKKKGIDVILSSSFESDIGLSYVAGIAARLSLKSPIGIGTYHFLSDHSRASPLHFLQNHLHLVTNITPDMSKLRLLAFLH